MKTLARIVLAVLLTSACNPNSPPRVFAGADLTIAVGEAGQLQGLATDPDGDGIRAWSWRIESAPPRSSPVIEDPTSPRTTFVSNRRGQYVLSLVARDRQGFSEPSSLTVTVSTPTVQPPPPARPTPVPALGSWQRVGAALALLWTTLCAASRART